MYKKTVRYKDFGGREITEDLFFNLTEAEMIELQWAKDGGYAEWAQRIINAKNDSAIMQVFKELLLKSYGVKSDDNKYFRKSPEITNDFYCSAAYNAVFMELVSDEKKAVEFFKLIIPEEYQEQAESKMIEVKETGIN
jgi:hypothetical protein